METILKVLQIDAGSGYYRILRFDLGDFFGPVDLGLYLSAESGSLNIGAGLFAGSIIPGSNRLIVNGFSPCWRGFYISSMGGAGLVFDNLGINMISITGTTRTPSALILKRIHGEEVQLRLEPLDIDRIWEHEGMYSLQHYIYDTYASEYENDPRILATGPAARSTDIGALASIPIQKGTFTHADTWAGRGGFGSKLFQEHGIAAIIYGGTFIDEDFRNREVADAWFRERYEKKLMAKDLESTTKYRFDPQFDTGGTFGINFKTVGGRLLFFNYRSIYMEEDERLEVHHKFILDHYLRQFNEETIQQKNQKTCGEPCSAVCKKLKGEYKKDYEPYQTLGPLSGVFDQRAAEKLNRRADALGFDAISAGGIVSWFMDCMDLDLIRPEEMGLDTKPVFDHKNFNVVSDSDHNANIGIGILDAIIQKRGIADISGGARKTARNLARERGKAVLDSFLCCSFARRGWMVPNQYWTPGVLSPMAIMGKYYMYYGNDFLPPRELGRRNAERLIQELILDDLGLCRFHRGWGEEMLPEILEYLYGMRDAYLERIRMTAGRINGRNSSVLWEGSRNADFVYTFLKRKRDIDGAASPELDSWIKNFEKDRFEASLGFWYEVHKGTHESLREF